MQCSKCGFENVAEAEFCANCGTKLVAAITCPSCGAEVSPGAEFCRHCGAKLTRFCPKCGAEVSSGVQFCSYCGQDLTKPVGRPAEAPVSPVRRVSVLPNSIAAAIGGLMMLISLAPPWYAIRLGGASVNVGAGDLLNRMGIGGAGPLWAGCALPLILMIIFASIVLVSAAISILTEARLTALWSWLGWLSMLCVIGNAVYFLWWIYDSTGVWSNIVHAGSVLAFIGALVVIFRGTISKGVSWTQDMVLQSGKATAGCRASK